MLEMCCAVGKSQKGAVSLLTRDNRKGPNLGGSMTMPMTRTRAGCVESSDGQCVGTHVFNEKGVASDQLHSELASKVLVLNYRATWIPRTF